MVSKSVVLMCAYFCAFFVIAAPLSWANSSIAFDGQIDFDRRQIHVNVGWAPSSRVVMDVQQKDRTSYGLFAHLEHVPTPLFDLSTDITGVINVLDDDPTAPHMKGTLTSQYSLIDYRPLRELSAEIELQGKELKILSLVFGQITCKGVAEIIPPYKMDMTVAFESIDMNDFINFWAKQGISDSVGEVNGAIKISGSLENMYLKGNLESESGVVKTLSYDKIHVELEGIYPHMEIVKSLFSETAGFTYSLNGSLDLSKPRTFKTQLGNLKVLPIVNINTTGSDLQWTIKQSLEGDDSTVETRYFLKKNRPGALKNVDSDMIGVQRTLEF